MKILVATGLYPPDIGGPATYARMLEEHLPEYGIELVVAPYGWVRRYPKPMRHLVFAWKLMRESKGCDALYALDPVSVGLPALIACWLTKKPLFIRIAGDYAWEQGQLRFGVKDRLEIFYKKRFSYGLFVSILSWAESFTTKNAALVVIPCEYLRDVMRIWGVEDSRVHVVYSALFPLTVTDSRDSIRRQLAYKGVVIVSAGRLVPNKGFAKLLEVFAEIIKEKNDMSLVIIGDGPQENMLKELTTTLNLENKVRFTGRLTKDALGAAIKGADLFVLNTEHEGFSHQLLEVMDLGVPIVTTCVGGNIELIQDGITGLLVEYGDQEELKKAIKRVLGQTNLHEEIVQRARLRTKDFDKRKVVGELAEILKRTMLST
jgi:glycosyltransferase involved in cell wall biosynthesis